MKKNKKTSYAHKSHTITDCLAFEMCYFQILQSSARRVWRTNHLPTLLQVHYFSGVKLKNVISSTVCKPLQSIYLLYVHLHSRVWITSRQLLTITFQQVISSKVLIYHKVRYGYKSHDFVETKGCLILSHCFGPA